jgi:predicted membrane channel-forming protein YqfA (hemolysin III family)
MQTKHPWELHNTYVPVLLFVAILFIKIAMREPTKYNREQTKLGLFFMVFAVTCFILGLDDDNDYLRIYHGFWHLFGSIANFYLWQVIDRS